MKRAFEGLKGVVVVLLCMCSWVAYAEKALVIHAHRAAPTFQVTLSGNPTTGYQWTVGSFDHSRFKLKSKHYIAPQSKLVGAGGQMLFVFQLLKGKHYPKQTVLNFSYAQPWNPSRATPTVVTVVFE